MVRIAVSGHRGLPTPVQRLIDGAIRVALKGQHDVIGLSCLADGADQIFARAVGDHGGPIEAVIPATHYRDGLPSDAHAEYDRLLAQAATVHRLPFTDSTPKHRWPRALSCSTTPTSYGRSGTANQPVATAGPPTS